MGVSEVVEADPWQGGSGYGPFERLGQGVGVDEVAVLFGVKRHGVVADSEFIRLSSSLLGEHVEGGGVEVDGAWRVAGLATALLGPVGDGDDGWLTERRRC